MYEYCRSYQGKESQYRPNTFAVHLNSDTEGGSLSFGHYMFDALHAYAMHSQLLLRPSDFNSPSRYRKLTPLSSKEQLHVSMSLLACFPPQCLQNDVTANDVHMWERKTEDPPSLPRTVPVWQVPDRVPLKTANEPIGAARSRWIPLLESS